jgi:type IV secretory pathway ATPase VirB11/archaellum biosynthesis ATPase
LILYQKRDYEYDEAQTALIVDIARVFSHVVRQKNLLSYSGMGSKAVFNETQYVIFNLLKSDPIGAFVELKRILRRERITLDTAPEQEKKNIQKYVYVLSYLVNLLERTKMITLADPYLAGYNPGDRSIYRKFFNPSIKPDFMFTKLLSKYPTDAEELDNYIIGDDTEITIFKLPGSVQNLYHVNPPEFNLDEEKYELLDMARAIMAEHKPSENDFIDPIRMRKVFFNVGRDLIEELASHRNIQIRNKEIDKLARILVRYTVGFGLIEVLLQDEKIQDISVNSPLGRIPMFIVHADFDDCKTNIVPTKGESESWASKLRLISGRPLDEANPLLDTELELPGASTRVSVISPPLNPTGLGFSLRRHRDKPWTLPLFIIAKMVSPLGAGLLSFMVDGSRSMLIAGTRGAGKSSFLSSLMIEIMRRYRIITVEDTLELPVSNMRNLGFNIQSIKVASALSRGTTEMSADDGIRATLRLGDSALIVGEVRSTEAKALYEAMRVGAAANIVAGTIHGDSPYGCYDRVVNDIGVPKTSFKATDLIIITNPIKTADGLHKFRRVTQITEVRKKWENDPMLEGGFVDLMKYESKTDTLNPTDEVLNGDSEALKAIAGNIKDFAGNWDALWGNVLLRAKIKETIVNYSDKLSDPQMLEAPFTIKCNDMFHVISDRVNNEIGGLDSDRIYSDWIEWLKLDLRKRK